LAGGAVGCEDGGGCSLSGISACRTDCAGGVVGGAGSIGGVFSGVIVCSGVKVEASWVRSIEGKRLATGPRGASGEAGETNLGEGGDTRA
jgi:hypothetical protein